MHDHAIDTLPRDQMLNRLIDYASGSLDKIYLIKPELYYSDIFLNPNNFVDTLFSLLKKNELSFTQDKQIVLDSIEEFKNTCIDPLLHFNNNDSIYWIGWCAGLIKFFDIPLSFNLLDLDPPELLAELKKFNDFFITETKKVMFTEKVRYE